MRYLSEEKRPAPLVFLLSPLELRAGRMINDTPRAESALALLRREAWPPQMSRKKSTQPRRARARAATSPPQPERVLRRAVQDSDDGAAGSLTGRHGALPGSEPA